MSLEKLAKFGKIMKEKELAKWPIGTFKVKGNYALPVGEFDYDTQNFDDVITINSCDYDDDSGFPDDEFDRIIQEKCAENLPSSHFDLNVEETEQID